MESAESSFEEDQKFIGKLFLRYVAENEDLHDLLEGKEMARQMMFILQIH